MLSLNNSNDKISSFCSFSRAKLYFSNKLKKFTILVPQKFQYEYCVVSYLIWFSEFQHAIKYSIFFFFDNSNKYSNKELVKMDITFKKIMFSLFHFIWGSSYLAVRFLCPTKYKNSSLQFAQRVFCFCFLIQIV